MNKIGLHIIESWDGHLGTPRLVKLVEVSPGYVREVRRRVGPRCIIVVRWVADDCYPLDRPEERAREWVDRYLPDMQAMAEGDPNIVFEGYNEIDCGKADAEHEDTARRYAAFELERLRLMQSHGLRTCWGNFAPGHPHESFWPLFQPVLDAMQPGDFLGLHEYWGPAGELNMPYLCGRWAWAPVAPYLRGVPIIVTEIGRGEGGWLGPHKISPAQYLAELEQYNALMEASPNVLGGVVFTVRGYGWDAYHPDAIWPQVVGRYTGADWTDPSMVASPPSHALGPDPSVGYYHSSRHGYEPEWIILHDTEGPAEAALAWWRSPSNQYQSSAHWLVRSDGEVVAVVPEHLSAHHAGGGRWPGIPEGSTGGTSNINHVSIGIELEYPKAPASPPWPEAQLKAAAELVWGIAHRYSIPRDHVLAHAQVAPDGAGDPRNLDLEAFLGRVWPQLQPELPEDAIRNAAWNAKGIPYNPDAAFARYAREQGLGSPETAEFPFTLGERACWGQGFQAAIVWAYDGDWQNVKMLSW